MAGLRGGASRVSHGSGAPKSVMAGGFTVSSPCPARIPAHGAPPPSTPVQAARLCLSHQVQVIHVAAAPGLPVGTSASPGYHDNRMQGTRASVGCGSQRGSAIGRRGGLVSFSCGKLGKGQRRWG